MAENFLLREANTADDLMSKTGNTKFTVVVYLRDAEKQPDHGERQVRLIKTKKMKKIILGIAFACISFFAFASSDTKAPTPLSGEGEVCRTTKLLPNYYSVTYNCGSTTITVCCFDLYIAAYLYLQDNPASVVCAAIPEP